MTEQERIDKLVADLIADGMTRKDAVTLVAIMFNTCADCDINLFDRKAVTK